VSEAWVINASPLILFARIGRPDLFEQLAPKIIVPSAVFDEVRVGQAKDRTAAIALAWSGAPAA
jgi:predicted nucleic acid-binding protein